MHRASRLHSIAAFVCVGVVSLSAPTRAHAQAGLETDVPAPGRVYEVHPNAFFHDGFYLRGGLGFGGLSASPSVDGQAQSDVSTHGGGVAAAAMIGAALAPGVFIGGAFFYQQAFNPQYTENGVTYQPDVDKNLNFAFIGPFLDWYPNPRRGLHVGGFVGAARLTITNPSGDRTSFSPVGGAAGIIVGHDFWLSPHACLGVSLHGAGGRVAGTPEGTQASTSQVGTVFGVAQLIVSMLIN